MYFPFIMTGRSTGLWLVIVRRIVGLHKGSLIAETHEGRKNWKQASY